MKLKLKISKKISAAVKKYLTLVIIWLSQNIGLKSKMYLLLIDNSEHKKTKDVNDNVIVAISHNEYKVFLSNSKCIRHAMNRI